MTWQGCTPRVCGRRHTDSEISGMQGARECRRKSWHHDVDERSDATSAPTSPDTVDRQERHRDRQGMDVPGSQHPCRLTCGPHTSARTLVPCQPIDPLQGDPPYLSVSVMSGRRETFRNDDSRHKRCCHHQSCLHTYPLSVPPSVAPSDVTCAEATKPNATHPTTGGPGE